MRPIDADALFKTVNRLFYSDFEVGSKESEKGRFRRGYNVAITDACEAITAAPTLSPDEVRGVGEWIHCHSDMEYKCSLCGKQLDDYVNASEWAGLVEIPNYCPNCGARMKGAEVEDGTTDTEKY